MADGPGARTVDRVGVLVLPDSSKFQPALKKYLARVSKQERLEVRTELDDSGLARQAKTATEAASKTARVTASGDLSDGFLSQMQRDVAAAMRQIEADVPLTADGERLRREVRTKVAEIQSTISTMAIDVPLDPEAAAASKADLRKEIAELQALAKAQKIDVPLGVDSSAVGGLAKGAGGLGSMGGNIGGGGGIAAIAAALALAVPLAVLLGSTLAALPALLTSIAVPLGVIALGWDGIAEAAKEAQPGFMALKNAVSMQFAKDLAPVFRELGEALPKLIPSFTALSSALSGAFGEVISSLTSDEGISKISGIIDNITKAVETLSPVLGPMVDTFLDFVLVGTKAFVDNSPQLLSALQGLTAAVQFLVDSGALAGAVSAFTTLVTWSVYLWTAFLTLTVAIAAVWDWLNRLQTGILSTLVSAFSSGVATVRSFVTSVWSIITTLPGLISGALSGLGSLVSGIISGAMSLARSAAGGGVSTIVAAIGALPGLALGVLAGLGSMLSTLASNAMSSMSSAMSGGVGRVVGAVAGLGGSIIMAIAGIPGMLYNAGANMISSLANGMTSRLSSVASAAAAAAAKVKGFFPGSPVKEGPLTSWNHANGTSGAGRRLINDLARGMRSQQGAVASAASRVAGAAAGAGRGDLEMAGLSGLSKQELLDTLYSATYRGTAQRGRDELGAASTTPTGRRR